MLQVSSTVRLFKSSSIYFGAQGTLKHIALVFLVLGRANPEIEPLDGLT